jgi:hypothetical protein
MLGFFEYYSDFAPALRADRCRRANRENPMLRLETSPIDGGGPNVIIYSTVKKCMAWVSHKKKISALLKETTILIYFHANYR